MAEKRLKVRCPRSIDIAVFLYTLRIQLSLSALIPNVWPVSIASHKPIRPKILSSGFVALLARNKHIIENMSLCEGLVKTQAALRPLLSLRSSTWHLIARMLRRLCEWMLVRGPEVVTTMANTNSSNGTRLFPKRTSMFVLSEISCTIHTREK